jgi:ABC-type oligopeptide transport system substrate-binding subunit
LPDGIQYQESYERLQEIFAEEVPALPLYQRLKLVAMRPDMCPAQIDPAFGSALSQVEAFDYGEICK